MVVDRQQHRLQQHRLGERRLDDQQGGVGEVHLALGVAPDRAGEPVVGQPVAGSARSTTSVEGRERLVVEAERLDRVQRPADAGHHAVPAALGQPPREQLEDRAAVGRAVAERRLEHGQLVVVGQQGRSIPRVTCPAWAEPTRQPGVRRLLCHDGRVSATSPVEVEPDPHARRDHRPRQAVGDHRLERPGEPHVLRDASSSRSTSATTRRRPRS